jgi:hypothetical protein
MIGLSSIVWILGVMGAISEALCDRLRSAVPVDGVRIRGLTAGGVGVPSKDSPRIDVVAPALFEVAVSFNEKMSLSN